MLSDVRDTPEVIGRSRRFEAAATIFCGALVAINAAGKAVPAGTAGSVRVVGRAVDSVAAGESLEVDRGVFRYDNGAAAAALAAADIGAECKAFDDATVGKIGAEETGALVAGTVFNIDESGVWVDVGR